MPITNNLNLPQPFVDAVTDDYRYKDKRYSVTSVLKGTCEAILQRRHQDEVVTDVADKVWLIFGKAVHSILENSNETPEQLKENWLAVDMPNGYTLSGIFDLYDDKTGTVTDYKTASVWKAVYDEWEDYRKQLLIYCWMLQQIGFDAKRGQIVAMLKDHSKSKAKFDKSYPQYPVVIKEWEFTEEEFVEVEKWLNQKFREIEWYEDLEDSKLECCTPEERWAKPTKWAVMKKGRKSAVRLYEVKGDAYQRAAGENRNTKGEPYYVEERPGTDTKCTEYCSVCEFCPYWREKYSESDKEN